MRRDSVANTLLVAGVLCVVCSVLVSITAVSLREQQDQNAEQEFYRNILECCGLYNETVDINQVYTDKIERRMVELASGQFVGPDVIEPNSYNVKEALRTEGQYNLLERSRDKAAIKRQEKYSFVYLYREQGELKQVILPIRGYGLWSTLYGFISLDANLETIEGITFYDHKETPGLGGEVDNPKWKQQWQGKVAFDSEGKVKVEVVRGRASDPSYQVDGLAGATITTRGVSNLVNFWLGPDGFGTFLDKRPFLETLSTGGD